MSARCLGQPRQRGTGGDGRRLIWHASAAASFDIRCFRWTGFFVSPLATLLPLGETRTTLATRVRRMVLGQVVALTRL